MKLEEHIDTLVYQLNELGFADPDLHSFLLTRVSQHKILYLKQDFIGKDEMIYEVKLEKDKESGLHSLMGLHAMLLQKGVGVKTAQFTWDGSLADVTARDAYNLLNDRGVVKFELHREGEVNAFYSHWIVLEKGRLKVLPEYNFMAQFQELRIQELLSDRTALPLINNFIRGERVQVHLSGYKGLTAGFVEADPRHRSLNLYDVYGVKVEHDLAPAVLRDKMVRKPASVKRKQGHGRKNGKGL